MPCSHEKCPNDPSHRPHILARSKLGGKSTKIFFIRLGYCNEHQATYKLENLLSDEGFAKIVKFMREKGLTPPERPLTALGWSPLTPDEIADLADEQHFTQTGDTDDELAF